MERAPKGYSLKLKQSALHNHLIVRTDARDAHSPGRRSAHAAATSLLDRDELLACLPHRHEARRQILRLPPRDARQRSLTNLDVEEREGVQADIVVLHHLVVEGVWTPRAREEADGNCLAKPVELQAAAPNRIHDRGVVHHFVRDAELLRAREEVAVRRRAERVSHDQHGHVLGARALEDRLDVRLAQLSRGELDLHAPCGLEPLLWDRQHRGVRLDVDHRRRLDSL
mmetsp:Transcript_34994/g.87112  ORF Transcript_34994/g.87112 Transcript_34994/m.87112 type:complete len:227 (+) Transcript_34994:448-1128(+)